MLMSAFIEDIQPHIKLSANWMSASGFTGEDAKLYEAVKAIGVELCPALGSYYPSRQRFNVHEKYLAVKMVQEKSVTAPLSLVISAFC